MGLSAAKSPSPAKGDRGKSESAIKQSYFEMHRTRHRCSRPLPVRPGPADHIRGEPVPRRGWKWWTCGNGGMLDFRAGGWKSFPTVLPEI